MNMTWLNNGFISKDLYTPFVIEKDIEYIDNLRKKYKLVLEQAKNAGADAESLQIIKKYRNSILASLKCYYTADLAKSNTIIMNLIRDIGQDHLAVDTLDNSEAFPGTKGEEIQFFRCRLGKASSFYTAKDMMYLPKTLRSKTGYYRFSIPGNPCFYLANSSYGCWIETGFPPENEFNVSPVILDGTQKVFNLAVSIRDFHNLNDFEKERVHCWLKLYMLAIATSYKVREEERAFKSEYIVSQAVMMACKKLGYDGVAYYSKRVSDDAFSFCAVNLALFVNYEKAYSQIIKHIKIDDAYNYAIYKQLLPSLKYKRYSLRVARTGLVTNIGNYDKQYPYRETEFFNFDQFLFSSWCDKPNGKGKNELQWGSNVDVD